MDSDSDYNPQTFERKMNRSKSKQKRVRFTPETKIRMIQLYERHPCLWDTKHLDYWNRIERSKAEKEIADLLKYPEALVNAKWQVLRNEFRVERNKVLKGHNGGKKAYESKWPFYSFMQFLNNHSNRPYKLSNRRLNSTVVGERANGGSVAVKFDIDEELNGANGASPSPISIDSKLSLIDGKHSQMTGAVIGQSSAPIYSNVCTYVTEKRPQFSHSENVSQCLEIIDELSKKIRPADRDDDVRVFGEFVATQLKLIKTKSCRGKCVHEIQRALMDWQNKDDEFVNQLQPQQEWQIQEETDLSINKTATIDATDANDTTIAATGSTAADPLDGELASLGFDV